MTVVLLHKIFMLPRLLQTCLSGSHVIRWCTKNVYKWP